MPVLLEKHQEQKRLLYNSVSGVVLFFVNLVVVFINSPVIVRQLGNRDYGIWDIILSFCGYLGLLEIGFGPAIIRFIARSTAVEDHNETKRIFVTAASSLLLVGVIAFLIMATISISPYAAFNVSPAESPHLKFLCILAGLNLLVQFWGTAPIGFLMGLQLHYRVNLIRIILTLASGAATYLALVFLGGSGLLWLAIILLAGNILQYALFSVWVFRTPELAGLAGCCFSPSLLKDLFSFGINSSLLMLSDRIQRQSLPFVIGHSINVAHIVFYSIPARLVEYGISLIMAIGLPISPLFSAMEARGGIEAARNSWLETGRWIQILMLWLAAGLGILGGQFISIWMGPQYAEQAKWVIIYLSSGMFVAGLAPNSTRLLVALGKHGEIAIKLLLISVVAVGCTFFSAKYWGLPGVALAVTAANIAGFVLCWHRACTWLKMTIFQHLRMTLRTTIPPALAFAMLLELMRSTFSPSHYLSLSIVAISSSLIYCCLVWLIAIKREERTILVNRLLRRSASPSTQNA